MTARRPLLTAAAAGSVLFALWFVPSANATAEADGATPSGPRAVSAPDAGADRADTTTDGGALATTPDTGDVASGADIRPHFLADTGSPDTTPYVIGGVACLALGAGLVSYSVRRTHDDLL
ncbi:hypothetical protein [Streptomyces sp. NPDC020742]|uniref:hypothetical protein n=1 Tax=Streptomyces sp. NPDC020742 TaxID=3154897 RepID=UPI0033C0B0EB